MKKASDKEKYIYMVNAENLPYIMDVEDVQAFMNMSRKNTYELVHRNDFPKIVIGRRIKIPTKKFLEWLDNNTDSGSKRKGA